MSFAALLAFDHAHDGESDRIEAAEAEQRLERFAPVGTEDKGIECAGHAHGLYQAHGLSLKERGVHRIFRGQFISEPGRENAFAEAFDQSRNTELPHGVDEDDLLGPPNGILNLGQVWFQKLMTVIPLVKNGVELEIRQLDLANLMERGNSAFVIGLGQGLAEAAPLTRGISVDDEDAPGHVSEPTAKAGPRA